MGRITIQEGLEETRVATFRRTPSGRVHMVQGTDRPEDARGVLYEFTATPEGHWADGKARIFFHIDGALCGRWTGEPKDATEIDVFCRLMEESLRPRTRRPLP